MEVIIDMFWKSIADLAEAGLVLFDKTREFFGQPQFRRRLK